MDLGNRCILKQDQENNEQVSLAFIVKMNLKMLNLINERILYVIFLSSIMREGRRLNLCEGKNKIEL